MTENTSDLDLDLEYTRQIRKQIIDAYMANGAEALVKDDPKLMSQLLKAADGIDSSALAKARLKLDETSAKSSAEIQQAFIAYTNRLMNGNPFLSENITAQPNKPELNVDALGEQTFVPGEGDIGVATETCEEFNARMNPKD